MSTGFDELIHSYNRNRPDGKIIGFCHAPFTNMYFGRNGYITVCCHNREHIIGRYPDQSIQEIWHGSKVKELRALLAANNLTSGCHVCRMDLEARNFQEVRALHFDSLHVLERYPSMMEFELANTCNLECTMCSGEFSSAIRQHREKLPAIRTMYDRSFADQLDEFIPYLREARFSGGEPFLMHLYFEIWEKIILLNPSCIISVQTNATVVNEKVMNILSAGSFEIGISVDSLDKKTFETIRKNAVFEQVMDHINFFSGYAARGNRPLRFSVCGMKNNWKELPRFLEFCRMHNAFLQIHTVWFPPASALWNLPPEELNHIHSFLSDIKFRPESSADEINLAHYRGFLNTISRWMKKPPYASTLASEMSADVHELKNLLFKKLERHIMENPATSFSDNDLKKQVVLAKAEKIFRKFDDQPAVKIAILKMLEIPTDFLIATLYIENEERIYNQALAFAES